MEFLAQFKQAKFIIPVLAIAAIALLIDVSIFNGITIFCAAATLISCIIVLLIPSSPSWVTEFQDCKKVIIVITAILILIFCFVAVNQSQFERYEIYAQLEYDKLAQALISGHVYLDDVPSDSLLALDNPYDYYERKESGATFFWDCAYFQGRYYVYFGILPCLLFFLPFRAITGMALPVIVAICISIILLTSGVSYFTWQLGKRFFPKASMGLYLVILIAQITASWTLFLPSVPNTYTLPIALGLSCFLWGVGLWISALQTTYVSKTKLTLGSLIMACTIAARPQMLIGFLFIAALIVFHARRHGIKAVIVPIVILTLCSCVIFGLQGWYNWARFENPLDFGATYNLTTNDMRAREFNIEYAPTILFNFLFHPPVFTPYFPFFKLYLPDSYAFGELFTEPLLGGLVALVPITWICIWLPLATIRQKMSGEHWTLLILSFFAMIVVMFFDAIVAGILSRYFMDFGVYLSIITSLIIGIGFQDINLVEERGKHSFQCRKFTLAGKCVITLTVITLLLQIPIVGLVT